MPRNEGNGDRKFMFTCVSNKIQIDVECTYLEHHSVPRDMFHFHSYKITVINHNPFPVQLLKRHWFIHDTLNELREVEGDGVVGKQPVIQPLGRYQYNSACDFAGAIGKMDGFYLFLNLENQEVFNAKIPAFICEANYILN